MRPPTTFKVYRYQLLPVDRHADDLFDGLTAAQLIERKNSIFAKSHIRELFSRLRESVSLGEVD